MTSFLTLLLLILLVPVAFAVVCGIAWFGVLIPVAGFGLLAVSAQAAARFWYIFVPTLLIVAVALAVSLGNESQAPNRTNYSSAQITELATKVLEREGVFDPAAEAITCPGEMEVTGNETCTLTSPKGGGNFRVELTSPTSVRIYREGEG